MNIFEERTKYSFIFTKAKVYCWNQLIMNPQYVTNDFIFIYISVDFCCFTRITEDRNYLPIATNPSVRRNYSFMKIPQKTNSVCYYGNEENLWNLFAHIAIIYSLLRNVDLPDHFFC